MSQRFIRCNHCGLPHNLSDDVCPVTGKAIRRRRSSAQRKEAAPVPQPEDSETNAIPLLLVSPRSRLSNGQRAELAEATAERSLVGRIISDKYRVLGLVGEGGMGTVYEAEHLEIGRHVAIKVLNRAHLGRKEAVARFYQEARAAGAIGHPNICEIYDVGRLGDGSPYLVMERLHGRTLADRVNIEGALPFEDVINFLKQVLSALVAAHDKKIIHRDIKPENVFLTERVGCAPVAKILDFGISKTGNANSDLSLTRTGMVMGTPFYMAPEQARGEVIDHRVDLYACGVMLYEVLTGRRPFIAANYNALVVQVLSAQPRDPREIRPAIPSGFVPILYKALSKRREDRYDDAASFIEALSKLDGELGRGPSLGEIKKLAEEVRRISTRPAAMPADLLAAEPPPLSDSMDIPVTFSETGTGAQSKSLGTGEVPVDLDTGGSPMADNSPTEVGTSLGFEEARKSRVTGAPARARQPSNPDEEVHDTIVDPTGSILGELWSQMGKAPAAVVAPPSAPGNADSTMPTAGLDAARAAEVLARADDPAFASTDADESDRDDNGRYSMVSSFPVYTDDDEEPPPTIDESDRTTQRPARRRSTDGGAGFDAGSAPARAPRPAGNGASKGEPRTKDLAREHSARRRAPLGGARPSQSSEPDDEAVTTFFVSSDDGPREANGSRRGAINDRPVTNGQDGGTSQAGSPRPPGTPRY